MALALFFPQNGKRGMGNLSLIAGNSVNSQSKALLFSLQNDKPTPLCLSYVPAGRQKNFCEHKALLLEVHGGTALAPPPLLLLLLPSFTHLRTQSCSRQPLYPGREDCAGRQREGRGPAAPRAISAGSGGGGGERRDTQLDCLNPG